MGGSYFLLNPQALVNPKSKHIPFRDSKLTRLLQDSLGGPAVSFFRFALSCFLSCVWLTNAHSRIGNTKTCMCAALGPGALSYDETMSTLRYANQAKNIKNKPKINEDPKVGDHFTRTQHTLLLHRTPFCVSTKIRSRCSRLSLPRGPRDCPSILRS
jgi:hypothetical protein